MTKLRVLLAKVGFDGHDRGVKILSAVLRDAGYEVIYLGKYLTIEAVIRAATEEDVDVIGLSFLGGAHVTYCTEAMSALREGGLDDVALIAGGVIPSKDFAALAELGVAGVFSANTATRDIVDFLDRKIAPRSRAPAQASTSG